MAVVHKVAEPWSLDNYTVFYIQMSTEMLFTGCYTMNSFQTLIFTTAIFIIIS